MTITTPQACEIFEINRSTLTRWRRVGADAAYVSRNRWDLQKLMTWWAENIYQGSTPDEAETLSAAKNRYWNAKAMREELRAKSESSQLAPISEIANAWAGRIAEMKAGLFAMVDRLPPILVGKSRQAIRDIIYEEVWELLETYARDGKFTKKAAGEPSGH